jgi:predicted transcriptional regulator
MIEKLLAKIYLAKNREITKTSIEEDFLLHCLRDTDSMIKLLKAYSTAATLRYFEAKTDEERAMAKGVILLSKLIRAGHKQAIYAKGLREDKQAAAWASFKKTDWIDFLKK